MGQLSVKDGIDIKRTGNSASETKKRKKTGMIAGIIAGAVVVILAAGTVAAGLYIDKLNTVYPNISIAGVELSGMTLDEATKALTDAGFENAAAKISVTVNFPNGEKLTVSGKDSGVKLQAGQAAQLAVDYGKDGSFFNKELTYVKSLFSTRNLDQTDTASLNESYVRGVVDAAAKSFNEKLMQGAFRVTDSSIEIIKGSNSALADADELYNLVVGALSDSVAKNEPVTVDYTIKTNGDDGIDLQSLYNTLHTEPVEAVYDKTTGQATQSTVGVSFDVDMARKMLDAAKGGASVVIPLVRIEPKVSTEQLQAMLFRDVLSEKSTYVSGTSNRVHNVALAAKAVNGTILNPGDEFSYNGTLGQRTAEKGYLTAGAYVGGKVEQEIGGGICQMSSTLYYCVLYADLNVVERSNHMFIVTYLPLGNDATVNWGTVDFKFQNSTDYPIRIESFYKDGYLTVRLHGTKTDTNTVKIKYEEISHTDVKTVYKEDPAIAPGTTKEDQPGHKGYVVDTYKYIYDKDGNLISKTFIAHNKYRVQDKVILVPVGTLTSPSPSDTASAPPDETMADPSELSPSPSTSPSPSPSESPSV
jgi:vancomycin resistance protein YoaR